MEPKASNERSRSGRPTSIQAARLTERLRRAAVDTFLEHGYDGTTMEAVAQAAGITKSTLYARYPDKRALFIAVSSWALTRQERDERVLEPLPDDLAESLTVIARAILARSVDPDIVRLSRMAIAEAPRFPEFAASSQAVTWSPRVQVIMDLLRRHERAGTVAVPDVELAAEQFFAMVGAMPAWLAAYGIYRTPEVEEQHLRHAVELFLNGVLVRGEPIPAPPRTGTAAVRRREPATAGAAALSGYRQVGRSGLRVSRLALGPGAFGAPAGGHDEQDAAELVHRYLDDGGNFLDVGDPSGRSEELCGRMLQGRRSDVVLATTVGRTAGRNPVDGATSRRHLRAACEASLRRLRTDHVDLFQVDVDDPATPLEETVEALDDLVHAGKVLYVGAANYLPYRLMKALSVSDRLGRARFVSLQGRYDLTARAAEREHFSLLESEGLGFVSVHRETAQIAGANADTGAEAVVRRAAAALGCTTAQLALAWLCTTSVTSVVVGARTVAQWEGMLAASGLQIPPEVAAELDEVTRLPVGQL